MLFTLLCGIVMQLAERVEGTCPELLGIASVRVTVITDGRNLYLTHLLAHAA
jgi:hypothetical protein